MKNGTLMNIGFVGVGRMGSNMALRLRDMGYRIMAVHDRLPEVAARVAAQTGAVAARTLGDVTKVSEVILTVVGTDSEMLSLFSENGDSLLNGSSGRIFVNCATLSPDVHVEIERRARVHGAKALEAAMASSITQARAGSLYLMVGGERETFERVRPMLEGMSASLRWIGTSGQAAKLKALVNMVMNINTAGLAEGLGLAEALGLDISMVREVFSQTGAASRVLETDGADMQNREHEVYFSAAHAAKDSHIALSLASRAGLFLPLAEATAGQYGRMVALGLGDIDKSGISELTFPSRHGKDIVPRTGENS
ncbi:MAG: NAD(P)-dependent oxidoreductase [Nitrospirae bacterium]|jgi:3-hydroxyisobutyrate dehydrogenase and related beta-hydroxyacid dehydrogenases|nr:NAD(P)-dependent oxidoreductase [Nitrospirota bacterium]MCL5284406.1 NAD(P)-dependent oxidoreductase [Nitrospirota bacterium]